MKRVGNENQHNLVKMARSFDASPAVTTGEPQETYFGSKRKVSGPTLPGPGECAKRLEYGGPPAGPRRDG